MVILGGGAVSYERGTPVACVGTKQLLGPSSDREWRRLPPHWRLPLALGSVFPTTGDCVERRVRVSPCCGMSVGERRRQLRAGRSLSAEGRQSNIRFQVAYLGVAHWAISDRERGSTLSFHALWRPQEGAGVSCTGRGLRSRPDPKCS